MSASRREHFGKAKSDGSQRIQLTYPPLSPVSCPAGHPTASRSLFYGIFARPERPKLYTVSADGGTPRELIPETPLKKLDATWSSDGTRIAFGGEPSNPTSAIRILDVRTHQVSTLPGSKGFFSPRWSPDGRYHRCHALRIPQPYAFRFCHAKVGGDREDQHGFSQLVEKRRLCLLPARGEPPVSDAGAHSRSEDRASGRPQELPASRLLRVSGSVWLPTIHPFCFATPAPRKSTPSTGRSRINAGLSVMPSLHANRK